MKSATVLEKAYELTESSEKAHILKELSALLQVTTLKTGRMYIVKAINYIEKN